MNHQRRWILPLGILLFSIARYSHADFDPTQFQTISFSKDCAHAEWSTTADNALTLILPTSDAGPCQATLTFYTPQEASSFNGLRLEARSVPAGAHYSIALQEKLGIDGTSSILSNDLTTQLQPYRIRFSHLQKGWHPQTIAGITIGVDSTTPATIYIRNIALTFIPAPFITHAAPSPTAIPVAKTSEWRLPLISFHHFGSAIIGRLALAILGLVAVAIWPRKRKLRKSFSPLYEINTRTWRSSRDDEGVLELGGFKQITFSDLKAIHASGFQAIWLMGIWEVGPKVRDISRRYGPDYVGSPFAISDYHISADLGTDQDFQDLVARAHSEGLSVIVDFIPNHMGLDSLWLNDHPEYFIHQVLNDTEAVLPDDELEKRYPGYFVYRTPYYPVGERRIPKTIMVAYGKDPYFYPWIDTAQLDYAQPGLRRKLIEVLNYWAKIVDGVRCDMAMLVLREQVKIHRHPEMSWETFNSLMPNEFWPEAIQSVKRTNPNFVFMAETYWSMEGYLQQLGFDYTYNKPLYESICNAMHVGNAEGFLNFLRVLGNDFLSKGVHFLENHDEERAMNTLGEERQYPAATILCTLPGVALLHQGQLEGKRERLPVQRVVPLQPEVPNTRLQEFYQKLLVVTRQPVFQEGRLMVLYSNNSALVCYARILGDSKALVIVNTSNRAQKGSVFITPGIRLQSGMPYQLHDLFYELKSQEVRKQPGVQSSYTHMASHLINKGVYVDLPPFDAHIFLLEPEGVQAWTEQLKDMCGELADSWPINRLPRRLLAMAFSRSTNPQFTDPT